MQEPFHEELMGQESESRGWFGGTPLEHPHRHASPLRRRRHPRYRKPWCCSYFALLVSSRATEALPAAPAYIPCTTDTSSNLWATTPKVSRLKPPDRAPSRVTTVQRGFVRAAPASRRYI